MLDSFPPEAREEITALREAWHEELNRRRELEEELQAVIAKCKALEAKEAERKVQDYARTL